MLTNGVSATLAENLRRETITQMRHYIENPKHSFFLALLMNVQDRKDILKLITTRYPDQPASETIDTDIDSQFSLLIDTLATTLDDQNNTTTLTEEKQAVKDCLTESSLKPLFTI